MNHAKIKMLVVGFFFFIMTMHSGWAQQRSENCTLVGRWSYGACYATFVAGNVAYMGNGGIMVAVDVSNPGFPARIGQAATPSLIKGIYVLGDYAYVADGAGGLRIFDVGNPASMNQVGFIETDDDARSVYVSGHYAYVAASSAGLRIIDVSTPSAPVEVASISTHDRAYDVIVSGGYAYVAAYSAGLGIFDVSTPASPSEVAFIDTPGRVKGVTVADRYAYVADSRSGLRIIDIGTPDTPTEVGFIATGGNAEKIAVLDHIAYVADWEDGLRIIDVATPSAPVEVGFIDPENMLAINVALSNGRAYVADFENGMRIIDIDSPSAPSQIGSSLAAGYMKDVVVKGRYAYFTNQYHGMYILDVSTPSSPAPVAFTYTGGDGQGIDVVGKYAYVADGSAGLRIFDVSNPSVPNQIGAIPTNGDAYEVIVQEHYAYVAVHAAGLQIIDISDPSAPVDVGSFDTGDFANDVGVRGSYAYITCYNTGLHIIDVSNPAIPTETAFLEIPNSNGLTIKDNYVYVANVSSGLHIIDVSTPSSPVEVNVFDSGMTLDVFVLNHYAYLTTAGGLRLINVSDPSAPVEDGFFVTDGSASRVYARGRFVFVADMYAGLYVLQNDLFPHPSAGETKLIADDGEEADIFGRDVAIDGDYAAVGAPNDDNENGVNAGAVYIYKHQEEGWVQETKIVPEDGDPEELFGYSVDLQGDYLAVGACWDDTVGEKSGSAYVYKRHGSDWVKQAKLIAEDPGADQRFGIDIAIDHGTLLVGAFFDSHFGERAGAADIFYLERSNWRHQAKLFASDAAAGDWFGVSVDLDGDYAVVGARYDDNENGEDAGAAYVFKRDGAAWNEQVKLMAYDGEAGDLFHTVSISNDWIAVGAYQADDSGDNSGSVYLYRRIGDSWSGATKFYRRNDAGEMLGISVALQGRALVVGAHRNGDNGVNAGAVYVLEFDGSNWSMNQKITASDGEAGDYFGLATAVSDGNVIIGARNDDDMGENAGAAYIYQLRLTPKTLRVPSEYATIGEALAVSVPGDTVLVAPGTYDESLTMNEGVALLSEAGPQQTIISGSGVQQLVMGARDAIIDGFTIAGNDNSESAAGSGISSVDDNVTISHCIIRNNRVGVSIARDSHARVFNNTICYNSLDGITMGSEPSPEIYNNIICKNTEGIYRNMTDASGSPFIQYNCYYGNGVNIANEGGDWTPEPGVGDIFAEPLFVGGSPFDYSLTAGSPCIDAGDPDSPVDPDGSRADMGALYYQHPTGVDSKRMMQAPEVFRLYPAYPNPFNPTTTIEYDLPQKGFVELTIHNVLGREIRRLVQKEKSAGRYEAFWDSKDELGQPVASGVYFYRIKVKTEQRTITDMGKMILMK